METIDITEYWKECGATEENEIQCFLAYKITTILKTMKKFSKS